MTLRRPLLPLALVLALPVAFPAVAAEKKAAPAPAPSLISAASFAGLEFRSIGPAIMGGRVDDFAVLETDPSTFYVGMAAGGILKTTNGGVSFEPVFDAQEVSSIGDLAIAASDPQIVYAGTGEPNNRQSSSWGNGVYKTTDGGRSWTHLGLADTHHIGRVAVHPANPDVVYVAALGRLWGPHKERGVFKTVDGGRSWTNVKFVDEDTGFVDMAMDPQSPDTLYAAAYQRRRTPFGYNGGGPGSGLWKTTDGGRSWRKLAAGLPTEGDVGRIGIGIYRKDPRIVYALVEHAKEGGTYRSEDRGESWTKVSATNPRPSYYSKIVVDPSNDQRVWVLGAQMFYSEDGGRSYRTNLVQKIHGDYHAVWIDPADSDHMLAGSDGGIHVSWDRGRSWDFVNTVPLGQCYEVGADMRDPYWVYCGLQDNGSWSGPSRTTSLQGISNENWFRVGGGDGFYTVPDPRDPDVVYVESQDGNLSRLHQSSGERRTLRPEPPAGEKYRFNWNSPILVSAHAPGTLYYGGNRLFASKDRGDTWSVVSPDLTTSPDRDALTIFGKTAKDFLSRNDGVVHFGTITTIAESPRKAGVLWVGTDDGQVQVSQDGGVAWSNVTASVPGVPKGTYVSRVEASRLGDGAAYVAFDGHRGGDFTPYLFRTEDYGRSWKALGGTLPAGGTLSVVREHPKNPDLILVGTERALFASFDRGARFVKLASGLPTVPVDDILVHPRENDLIVATHGRSLFVLDDAEPLSGMTEAVAAKPLHLFQPRPATMWRMANDKGNTGHKFFLAPNPPEGALLSYSLARKPEKGEAKVSVTDAAGRTLRELTGPVAAGVNRIAWDLRGEPPVRPREGAGGGGFFGRPRGPLVDPGVYTVSVAVGDQKAEARLEVREDPRIRASAAERKAWSEALRDAGRLWARADAANRVADSLDEQLSALQASLKRRPSTPEAVAPALEALLARTKQLAARLTRQAPLGFAGAPLASDPDPLLARARGLYFALGSITAAPTAQQRELLARLGSELDPVVAQANALVDTEVPAFNKLLSDQGVGRIDAGRRIQ